MSSGSRIVREESQSFQWKVNVYATASSIALATLAVLFFTKIIPLNPSVASLTAGSGCIVLMMIDLCCVFSLKNENQKNLQKEASSDPPATVPTDTDKRLRAALGEQTITQLKSELYEAVRQGQLKFAEDIIKKVTTQGDLWSLISEDDQRYSMLHFAVLMEQLEIAQLIINTAIQFNILGNILFYEDQNGRWCVCLVKRPKITAHILKVLKAHPTQLTQVLDWREPFSGHSLFQLVVAEESENSSGVLTTAILDAAKTVDQCMSTILFKDEDERSCFDIMKPDGALVIQAIMKAAGTVEHQLQVINFAKDENGYLACYGDSAQEIKKYELLCYAVEGNQEGIKNILKSQFRQNAFIRDGVIQEACHLAQQKGHGEIKDYLRQLLPV